LLFGGLIKLQKRAAARSGSTKADQGCTYCRAMLELRLSFNAMKMFSLG
jgi:hypothetical protein